MEVNPSGNQDIARQPVPPTALIKGAVGALAGAVAGYFAFNFMASNGLYMMVVPGAFIGIGCGYASRVRSPALGIVAAVVALVASVLIEWNFAPFIKDGSLTYFIAHIFDVIPSHLVMMAVGCLFGFWFGQGRERFTAE